MKSITAFAAAAIAVALATPAAAATHRMSGAQDWQVTQDRKACRTLGTEFKEAVAVSRDGKAVGHADSIAANARDDCNTGHYRAGREAFDEALAALGATPAPSWGDAAD